VKNELWILLGYLRRLHWRTLGQIRHSSGSIVPSGKPWRKPRKWAHLAGESRTLG
jgi:hypothetical protein